MSLYSSLNTRSTPSATRVLSLRCRCWICCLIAARKAGRCSLAAPEVYHLTNVHSPFDARIFYKQAQTLARAGYAVTVVGPGPEEWCGERAGVRVQTVPVARGTGQRILNLWHLLRVRTRCRTPLASTSTTPSSCRWARCSSSAAAGSSTTSTSTFHWWPWCGRGCPSGCGGLSRDWSIGGNARLLATLSLLWSEWSRNKATALPSRPFAVVKNYPRLEWYSPGCGELGSCALVHIGSLSEDRGGLFLLEIMRELAKTHPQVRLLSVGAFHSQELRERFEARRREWGLEEQIHYSEKRVPYDELGAAIAACQIGLIPGQVSPKNLASFVPTKLFEYLACGLPVVASDLPSIRRFLAVADWGLLADPSDPAAHARAIGCLLDDPVSRAGQGERKRGEPRKSILTGRPRPRNCWHFTSGLYRGKGLGNALVSNRPVGPVLDMRGLGGSLEPASRGLLRQAVGDSLFDRRGLRRHGPTHRSWAWTTINSAPAKSSPTASTDCAID